MIELKQRLVQNFQQHGQQHGHAIAILSLEELDAFFERSVFVEKSNTAANIKEGITMFEAEKKLGGGRVPSQKQFLDFDRKVLRFFTRSEDLQFVWHYFLADDTVEIREVHFPNDGRDSFSVYLRR